VSRRAHLAAQQGTRPTVSPAVSTVVACPLPPLLPVLAGLCGVGDPSPVTPISNQGSPTSVHNQVSLNQTLLSQACRFAKVAPAPCPVFPHRTAPARAHARVRGDGAVADFTSVQRPCTCGGMPQSQTETKPGQQSRSQSGYQLVLPSAASQLPNYSTTPRPHSQRHSQDPVRPDSEPIKPLRAQWCYIPGELLPMLSIEPIPTRNASGLWPTATRCSLSEPVPWVECYLHPLPPQSRANPGGEAKL
jgi:hypothetical protein